MELLAEITMNVNRLGIWLGKNEQVVHIYMLIKLTIQSGEGKLERHFS